MLVAHLEVLGFRNLADGEVALVPGITLVRGANGAGKTNLLDALYTALAGRSCRTRDDREAIAFGEKLARSRARVEGPEGAHEFITAISREQGRTQRVDGESFRAEHDSLRPPLAVFLPDRLVLVKGPPAARRAHLDRFCAALWPARGEARRRYGRALAQRNALLGRVAAGSSPRAALDAWDAELSAAAAELIAVRHEATEALAAAYTDLAGALGLAGRAELTYAPRCEDAGGEAIERGLGERRERDIARGFTTWGPHLDELALRLDGRTLRRYGSQGQQRVGVLALLFAEREALMASGRPRPLMLLDDVASELDPERRRLLCELLEHGGGQALLTATEAGQLPTSRRAEVVLTAGRALAAREAA